MTPEQLRAVIAGIVDHAGSLRLSGEIAYANGLMDAAGRLKHFLPDENAVGRAPKAVDVVVVPAAVAEPEPPAPPAPPAPVPIDAVDEPPKRRRYRKGKS